MSRATSVPHLHDDKVADTVRVFLPASQWSGALVGSGTGTVVYEGADYGNVIQATTTVVPAKRLFATSGVGSFTSTMWTVPDNMDTGSAAYAVVYWSSSDTVASQTATFALTYGSLVEGAAFADATTALNTTIAADTDDESAYGLNITAQGTINAGSLTNGNVLVLKCGLTGVSGLSATADIILFHGVEFRYTRRFI